MSTIVGKLLELLAVETEVDGVKSTVVIPKGTVVEVSSEDEYPSYCTDEDFEEAANYLKEN